MRVSENFYDVEHLFFLKWRRGVRCENIFLGDLSGIKYLFEILQTLHC